MATVVLSLSTVPMDFPVTTTAGQWRFAIVDSTGADAVPSQNVDGPTASFDVGTLTGDFVASGQRLDVSNVGLGPIATASFTIKPATQPIDVAGSLSVSVTP